jgi:hypothetical protein
MAYFAVNIAIRAESFGNAHHFGSFYRSYQVQQSDPAASTFV